MFAGSVARLLCRFPRKYCRKEGKRHGKCRFSGKKTPEFSGVNIRTFEAKPRNFALKKSDVFRVPKGKRRKTAPEWRITPLLHVMQNIRTSHGVVASDGLLKALNAPKILKSVVISLPCRQEHSSAMRRSRSAPVPSLPVSLW